jgi:hypothetical protein
MEGQSYADLKCNEMVPGTGSPQTAKVSVAAKAYY